MPLKLHCIFNQPSVLPDIVKLVEKTAHALNARKKPAGIEEVYKELRENNYEIDAESVAFAYLNTTGLIGRKGFSNKTEIKKFGGEGIKSAIKNVNRSAILKARLGKLSVSTAVASGIASTFVNLKKRNLVNESRLFKLQDALKKAANSMLDKKGFTVNPKSGFVETLQNLFDLENVQQTSNEAMKGKVKGMVSSIDEIWDAVKADIATIASSITNTADRIRFEQMTDAVKNSSYELLLSTKQADDVIKGILKGIGYTKELNTKNGKVTVIDWNQALENKGGWQLEFMNALRNNGFTMPQSQRVVAKIEGQYNSMLEAKAESKLNELKKKNNVSSNKSDPDAIKRLIQMKNAGLFLPKNSDYLREAFGTDIPAETADLIKSILDDYERNISRTGNISNVEAEEVVRAIRNLLSPLGKGAMEKVVDGLSDYMGLRASSTISTIFNATQNITSGMNSALLTTISSVAKTKNPKIMYRFLKSWMKTFADVSAGGVTIRDAKTVNVLEQLQGRGGLSDRWTFDNAKGFFGYVKAVLNTIGQVTATAADAANGTVIYNAEIIKSVREVLKGRTNPATNQPYTSKEANRAIDDIIFGRDASGKTNRQVWYEEAVNRLENQEGVVDRKAKAYRIADELIWHKLVTDFGITVNDIKAIQSASLTQKSRNLGHQADAALNPSLVITGFSRVMQEQANEAKKKGNRAKYVGSHLMDVMFRTINMFLGGKANWAILSLQNSPFGIAQGLFDVAVKELANKKGEIPLYRQELATDNPSLLQDQLEARKALYGRFERGVYGTVIQSLAAWGLIALLSSGDDDDDKRSDRIKRVFDRFMADPNTARFFDKVAPTILAAELAYAYNKETNELDESKLSDVFFLPKYLQSPNKLFMYAKDQIFSSSGWDKLQESFSFNKKIKDEDERAEANAEATMRYVGNIFQIPYVSWFNVEKNEFKVIESGFQPDDEQRERAKEQYKERMENIEGSFDAFLDGMGVNTLIELFK